MDKSKDVYYYLLERRRKVVTALVPIHETTDFLYIYSNAVYPDAFRCFYTILFYFMKVYIYLSQDKKKCLLGN